MQAINSWPKALAIFNRGDERFNHFRVEVVAIKAFSLFNQKLQASKFDAVTGARMLGGEQFIFHEPGTGYWLFIAKA